MAVFLQDSYYLLKTSSLLQYLDKRNSEVPVSWVLKVEFLINHKYTLQDIKDFLKVHQVNFIPDQLRNEDMIYKVD